LRQNGLFLRGPESFFPDLTDILSTFQPENVENFTVFQNLLFTLRNKRAAAVSSPCRTKKLPPHRFPGKSGFYKGAFAIFADWRG
jgi:hypothetical protein